MQYRVGVGIFAVALFLTIPAADAVAQTTADILKRLDSLEKENAALRSRVKRLEATAPAKVTAAAAPPAMETAKPVQAGMLSRLER